MSFSFSVESIWMLAHEMPVFIVECELLYKYFKDRFLLKTSI